MPALPDQKEEMKILEFKFPTQRDLAVPVGLKDFALPLPVGCAVLGTRADGRQPLLIVLGDPKAKTESRHFSMRQTGAEIDGKYIGSFDLSASAAAGTIWYVFEVKVPVVKDEGKAA